MTAIALALHALAAVIWVGGMFFALVVLRPAAASLAGPERLGLMDRVHGRFFPWVLGCVVVLLLTGLHLFFAGIRGWYVHAMMALGIVMMMLFLHLFFAPAKRMRRAVASGDMDGAARQMGQIRMLVGINLVLGLVTVALATGGRYW